MKTLISIVGTTGIGKTKLAIDLARYYHTEILSCDSRQFFKEMTIGTASPTEEELSLASHHFVGNLSIENYYSIGQYELDALIKTQELFQKYDTLILVGGSMMYEKALIEGLNDLPESNEENQQKLVSILQNEGIENVDLNNPRRLLRAIDVMWQTGKKYSNLISQQKPKRAFRTIRIGIKAPRETIYERINLRVDKMIESGLIDEVKSLQKFDNDLIALKTVGYTEIFKYLRGEWELAFAISEIKKNSRRFAKRQLTWYRKEENIHWVDYQTAFAESVDFLTKKLQKV